MRVTTEKYSILKNNKFYFVGILFVTLTITALVVAFQHRYIIEVGSKIQNSLTWHIPFNLFYWWCWLIFLPAIYYTNKLATLEKLRTSYWFIFYLAAPIIIVLIHQIIASIVISIFLDQQVLSTLMYKRIIRNYWVWVDMFVYYAIIIAINLTSYHYKNKIDELKITQLSSQLVCSQLNALKSQLHPHFLFNTLNTLSTLILKEDNSEAQRMLELLKNLLKTTIYSTEKQEITLEDELRFINHYLDIEKVRFKDKLEVNEFIQKEALEALVPNFILQPIIENAIHHAIAQRTSNGIININANVENNILKLRIEDNGPGMISNNKKKKDGVGLKNTKERLKYLYGTRSNFIIGNSELGGLKVLIEFPHNSSNDFVNSVRINNA